MADREFARIRIHTETLESNIQRILDTMEDIVLSEHLKIRAIEKYRDKVNVYVPKLTGNLRESARSDTAIIDYKGDKALVYDPVRTVKSTDKEVHYGQAQYEGDPSWDRHTPDTYDHWNHHLTSAEQEEYYRSLAWMYSREIKKNVKH